jgi:hypothetical protein
MNPAGLAVVTLPNPLQWPFVIGHRKHLTEEC